MPSASARLVVVALVAATLVLPAVTATPAHADPASNTVVSLAGGGVADGAALQAALYATSAAYAPDGTLYLADKLHNRVRALTPDGTISTLAGTGALTDGSGGFAGDGGPATSAALSWPTEVAVSGSGDVYVLDSGNRRVRRIDHLTGTISTVAGNGDRGVPVASGDATSQPFDLQDITVEPATGAVAISDLASNKVWTLAPDGGLSVLAGGGSGYPSDGPALSAVLAAPAGLAYAPDGALLIADRQAGRVRSVKDGLVSTVLGAGSASGDGGPALEASIFQVTSLAVAPDGTVFASAPGNALRSFTVGGTISTISSAPCETVATTLASRPVLTCGSAYVGQADGTFARVAGIRKARINSDATADGTPAAGAALEPTSVLAVGTDVLVTSLTTVDRLGADGLVHRVAGLDDVAASGVPGGQAAETMLLRPVSLAAAPEGGLFLSDNGAVRLVTADGVLHPFSGTAPVHSGRTEGEPVAAVPYASALSSGSDGDLYFGAGNAVGVMRWADRTVHYLTTKIEDLAGPNTSHGFSEGVSATALDSDGSLLVLSEESYRYDNPTRSRVRRFVLATGAWSTLYDGPRLSALTVLDGTPYVATSRTLSTPARVARLADDGSLTSLAGGGHVLGDTQSGAALHLSNVTGLAPAVDGGLLVATAEGRRVLKVQPGFSATSLAPVTGLVVNLSGSPSVSWNAPDPTPSGAVFDYAIIESRLADLAPRGTYGTTTATTRSLGGLTPGRRYALTVYVVATDGDASAPTSLSFVAPGDTTPPSMANPNGVYSTGTSATFAFSTPTDLDFDVTELRLGAGAVSASAAPAWTGRAAPVTLAGLTVGQKYFFTLTSRDLAGNKGGTGSYSFTAGSAPLAGLDGPATGSFTRSSVTFWPKPLDTSGSQAACTLDGAWFDCAYGPYPVGGLTPGKHTFTLQATSPAGNGPLITRAWTVDTGAPSVTLGALPPFTLATARTAVLGGADAVSGVASWNVRYQRAAATGGFSGWTTKAAASRVSIPLTAGYTTCVQAQSKDRAGNVSAWSPSRCTTRPLDDRGLTASAGWSRVAAAGTYLGTLSTTKTTRAALTKSATFRQLALVVTSCPTCGSVGVYSGSTLLRTVSLASTTTQRQRLILLPVVSNRTATITLRSTSTRPVQIDGLGIAR